MTTEERLERIETNIADLTHTVATLVTNMAARLDMIDQQLGGITRTLGYLSVRVDGLALRTGLEHEQSEGIAVTLEDRVYSLEERVTNLGG